ncbi:hypothetical protein [Clostridium polynesiense]|uniref:hypothetical protein n=1 Tax=Clostridium polynesiense TaxID=1325933 RepID=UPI00059115F0|nr:hypothetical protein [Clostridium polynesiense]
MDINEIKQYLLDNDFSEVEEIEYKGEALLLRAFYDFDEDEIKAAKAYSSDESDYEAESEEWYSEFFLPYLSDLAVDNAGQTIEEAMEEFEVNAQFVAYDIDINNYDYNEFIIAFSEKDELDIESILEEIGL